MSVKRILRLKSMEIPEISFKFFAGFVMELMTQTDSGFANAWRLELRGSQLRTPVLVGF